MTITAQELLSFLHKLNQLSINYTIHQVAEEGYDIKMYTYNWMNHPENSSFKYVFIPNEGSNEFGVSFYSWQRGYADNLDYYDFQEANDILDARLKEKYEKEEKERKRQELLNRLTAEERELLGV